MRRAAAAIVFVAALLFAAPAHSAFPGDNGLIAVEQSDYNPASGEFGSDILVRPMLSRSTGTNLTNSPGINDIDPAWDATGNLIAFASDRNGDLDLYMMRPDGTDVRQLTFGAVVRRPTWSPDGSKIAVETRNPDGTNGIWVVTVNGTEPAKPVLPFGGGQPAWSPDGTKIAYVSNLAPDGFTRYLHVMNADGTGSLQISDLVARDPDWAPDGSEIAVSAFAPTDYDWEIYAVRADGAGERNVSNSQGPPPWGINDLQPAWSPDGTKIATHVETLAPHPRDGAYPINLLMVLDASGSGPAQSIAGSESPIDDPAWQLVGEGLDPFTRPYARPGSATPLRVPLVPAYADCASPNSRHAPPLDLGSCTPPVLQTPVLTTSGKGRAVVRLRAIPGNRATAADEADLGVTASVTDVVCRDVPTIGCSGVGSDYSGRLLFTMGYRITDRGNPFSDVTGTVSDVPNEHYRALRIPLACAPTAGPPGGTCKLDSTADAFLPGLAREGARSVISELGIEVWDLGYDGVLDAYGGACPPYCAGTGDENRFLVQGLFIP